MLVKSVKLFFILFAAFFQWACGLDDLPFLYPVPDSNVTTRMGEVTIRIPDDNDLTFTHFAIYYKIYISDVLTETPLGMLGTINQTLSQDYNAILPRTDPENMQPASHDFFRGRGFFPLEVRGDLHINRVLDSSLFGSNLIITFPLLGTPTLTAGGTSYALYRSEGSGPVRFEARPDRLFRNRPELTDTISNTINADVAGNDNVTADARVYTYVAMYIVSVGFDPVNQTSIFSTATLVNVFQLPG